RSPCCFSAAGEEAPMLDTHLQRQVASAGVTLPQRCAGGPRTAASVDEEESSVMECLIALTQDWTVRVDPWWYPLLRGYRWQARRAGREGRWRYAGRSLRTPRGQVCVAMARVILGCQELDTGEVVRPGKVGLWEMPDLATQRIDLREQNLFYGSAQDI